MSESESESEILKKERKKERGSWSLLGRRIRFGELGPGLLRNTRAIPVEELAEAAVGVEVGACFALICLERVGTRSRYRTVLYQALSALVFANELLSLLEASFDLDLSRWRDSGLGQLDMLRCWANVVLARSFVAIAVVRVILADFSPCLFIKVSGINVVAGDFLESLAGYYET